jgi:hypothetical protein
MSSWRNQRTAPSSDWRKARGETSSTSSDWRRTPKATDETSSESDWRKPSSSSNRSSWNIKEGHDDGNRTQRDEADTQLNINFENLTLVSRSSSSNNKDLLNSYDDQRFYFSLSLSHSLSLSFFSLTHSHFLSSHTHTLFD